MTTELDMFQNVQGTIESRYPVHPGWKAEGTSKLAAVSVKKRAKTLRERVLNVLQVEKLTADEVATKLGESVLSVRPRCSELLLMHQIRETSERRRNVSGKWATVLTSV